MLNSIVGRNRMNSPLNEVEKTIIRSATRLFLQNGFSKTTLKMISEDCGMLQGRMCYHFHTKEDMLYLLIQELTDYHTDIIDEVHEEVKDELLAYAMEITAQIVLCEEDKRAWDLYYSAYTLPGTYALIKEWGAKKNYHLLKDVFPHMSEEDFRVKEIIQSSIEISALTNLCDRSFNIEDKIELVLDSMMKIYDVSKEKRREVIDKILKLDYRKIAHQMFDRFLKRLDHSETE